MATITTYNYFKKFLVDGSDIDLVNDTVKLALCDSSYVPNIDTHDYFDNISGELSGGGYTTGGNQLDNPSLTVDTTNNRVKFDADDESFTALTATDVRYGIIYIQRGGAATSPLVNYVDFGANKSITDGTITFAWHANGVTLIS